MQRRAALKVAGVTLGWLICLVSLLLGSTRLTPALEPGTAGSGAERTMVHAPNEIAAVPGGYRLTHPRHSADFSEQGVRFAPRAGGVEWKWRLTCVCTGGGEPVAGVTLARVGPEWTMEDRVIYRRGAVVEEYLARPATVEQRFVIAAPLGLGGEDLEVTGVVDSEGTFAAAEDGWVWRGAGQAVRLGGVTVVDAAGRRLAAEMWVTARTTRIRVTGAALAKAQYPVTIDPEIGTNDFRVSVTAADGDPAFDAEDASVVYNPLLDEYFVVWRSDDSANDEYEVYGQRLSASTGEKVGSPIRISNMGLDGSSAYKADNPVVTFNGAVLPGGQYLVVWESDDNTGSLTDDELEIFGQLLDAQTGSRVGNRIRISDMGPDGDPAYDARFPDAAYSSGSNRYLVVWRGDDDTPPFVDEEIEIYGQILRADGASIGGDVRLSSMGPTGDVRYAAAGPRLAYNSQADEFLVTWRGEDNAGSLVDEEWEVFGRRMAAASGSLLGGFFRVSSMGGADGDERYDVLHMAVAYNRRDNEYLVVWRGDSNTGDLVDEEYEVFAQRLNAAGALLLPDEQRISDVGPSSNPDYDVLDLHVTYSPVSGEYLVVWYGEDNGGTLVNDELEVFGQRLSGQGIEVGENDFRLSDAGPDGNILYRVDNPVVAADASRSSWLVAWSGEDNLGSMVDGETEIFGQRYSVPFSLFLPAILKNHITYYDGLEEREDNDTAAQANGPLRPGQVYTGVINDDKDYYSLVTVSGGAIIVTLAGAVPAGTQLQLFYEDTTNRLAYDPDPPYQITVPAGAAGRYYIYVASPGGQLGGPAYTLKADFTP